MEVCNIVWEVVTKTIPKESKYEKEKRLPEKILKTTEKIREGKGKEKGKDTPNGMQTSREKQGEIRKCS